MMLMMLKMHRTPGLILLFSGERGSRGRKGGGVDVFVGFSIACLIYPDSDDFLMMGIGRVKTGRVLKEKLAVVHTNGLSVNFSLRAVSDEVRR